MLNLLDNMFIKRFCLPIDAEIELYESGRENINKCLCGHYNHVSCILHGKKSRILTYGFNKMGDTDGLLPGVHAEYDAIRKLIPLKNKKRLKNVNILVIRVSGKNKLQSSKPCANCVECMATLPIKLGYRIQHIYYSNNDGSIVKTNLKELDNDEKHLSRFYRQHKIEMD